MVFYLTHSLADFPVAPVPGVNVPWRSAGERKQPARRGVALRNTGLTTTEEKQEAPLSEHDIVRLVKNCGAVPFTDELGKFYCWFPLNGHFECLQLKSRQLMQRLISLAEAENAMLPTKAVLSRVVDQLELEADRNEERELSLRFHQQSERLLIDVGDKKWSQIAVCADGWQVEPMSEPRFRRQSHMQQLPMPQREGNYDQLFDLLPDAFRCSRLVILTWLLSAMLPRIPTRILLITGSQGSGKTKASRKLRSLVDPSRLSSLGRTDKASLERSFLNHAVPVFENVSSFSNNTSDDFSRAATGNSFEVRRLYTTNDTAMVSYRRPFIINGIHNPSSKADFIDRCIGIHCDRLTTFRPEEDIDAEFAAQAPSILGGLLNLLVEALRARKSLRPESDSRMADFDRMGRAIAVAEGRDESAYSDEFQVSERLLATSFTDGNSLASLLKEFATKFPPGEAWSGNATDLCKALREFATENPWLGFRSGAIPSYKKLGAELTELQEPLQTAGVRYAKHRVGGSRNWIVSRSQS